MGLVADAAIYRMDAELLVTSAGQWNFGGTFRKANVRKPTLESQREKAIAKTRVTDD